MTNDLILRKHALGLDYLDLLHRDGYTIVDMNMIEPFTMKDKNHHPTSIVFERNNQIYAIRSDWTRTLLNHNENFYSEESRFGYYGPVVREHQTFYQAGVEIFKASDDDIIDSLLMHMEFVEECVDDYIQTIVINNDQLIDLFIDKYNLGEEIRPLIYDKAVSELANALGAAHPLYKIMTAKVSAQLELVHDIFGDSKPMQFINELKKELADEDTRFILDLSFRSPQSYYNGFYFQAFLNHDSPILSGGEYNSDAFGIGLNLSDGGLL